MNNADRLANSAALVLAALAWAGFALVVVALDPRTEPMGLLAGALLLGGAIALTLAPLLWLAGFARNHRIAYRGDWTRAARRAGLTGLVVALLVLLRGEAALNLPLGAFVVAMAVLVEVALSMRR